MSRSRTINTLAVLLGALTLGTFALLRLETAPARPPVGVPLAGRQGTSAAESECREQILDTAIPLRQQDWRHIVIHDDACLGAVGKAPAAGVHFVIHGPGSSEGDGVILATPRWRRQADGAHISLPGKDYNASSIGVLLTGDLSETAPSTKQLASLVALARALQGQFAIGRQYVYMHGDLTGAGCPGAKLPVAAFRRQLVATD